MARIRTVKPALFRHSALFDAEKETGLPLRIAFVGLFTACDREGRFKWEPRELKLDVLPFDEIDFSRVLDALATRGFVRKYGVDGATFGVIPTFNKHQVINNKESASDLPAPSESTYISVACTRDPRVDDALPSALNPTQGEGKGNMEGKGETLLGASAPGGTVLETDPDRLEAIEATLHANLTEPTPVPKRESKAEKVDEDFERAWSLYPKRDGGNPKKDALNAWNARRREGVPAADMITGVERYAAHMKARGKLGTEYVMQAQRFFGTSKQYAEPWPVAQAVATTPPRPGAAPSSMMRPNASDYSSSDEAAARTQAHFDVQADGNLDF